MRLDKIKNKKLSSNFLIIWMYASVSVWAWDREYRGVVGYTGMKFSKNGSFQRSLSFPELQHFIFLPFTSDSCVSESQVLW